MLDCELETLIQFEDELLDEGANQLADNVEEVLPPKMEDIDDMNGLDRADSAPMEII